MAMGGSPVTLVGDGSGMGGLPPYSYTPVVGSQFGLGCAAATSLTVPAGAQQCVVSLEGANARYTYDGVTTPTSTVGQLLVNGASIQFCGAAVLANLKFIQVSATASLNVEYTR